MLLTLHCLPKNPADSPIEIAIEWAAGMWMRRMEENKLTFLSTVNEKGLFVIETPEEIRELIKQGER